MIRTFLAVDFDDPFLDEVAALAQRLRGDPRLSAARWAARETLHTTVRFLGDTSDAQVATLRRFVKELADETASFAVRAPWVHGFPARARAHVLVLDVAAGELASLATRAEALAVSLGFAAESRPYHAHLTLARMRKTVDVSSLAAEAASLPLGRVTAITLYASSSSPSGAVYTPLERAVLP